MAEGVLGLGSGQAASLNNDLIDKLREAERKATVAPIENRIENITGEGGESETIKGIISKANELLETIKPFDLFVSGGVTAFDKKSANVTGSSAVFAADDETALNEGTTTVVIKQLAKRDVFQSSAVDGATKDATIDQGTLTIALAGADNSYSTSYDIDTTGKTYQQVADEINLKSELTATIEQVGDDSYRLVVKSAESGESNALQISGLASTALGYDAVDANIQEATNLNATVNGIDYNVSTNVITVDGGLKITAVEENKQDGSGNWDASTISVEKDASTLQPALQDFVNKYNELVTLVDNELYSADSKIEDSSTLRTMMEGMKSKIFGFYGEDKDLSIFNVGFELDKSGYLSIDSTKLSEAIENNPDDLKMLFLGTAETTNRGLGTQLKEYVDGLDSFDGLLTKYEETLNSRKDSLNEEKTKAEELLTSKYSLLSQQFAAYGSIINQFESSFSGLKLMIQQSTAK